MEFPFERVTANQLSFAERDERYRRLHDWPSTTHRHPCGLTLVWKYDDARQLLEASTTGISNANALDPLVGYPRIAAPPRAMPHLLRHLVPLPAKATANLADDRLHKRVWDTMAGPAGHFTIAPADRASHAETMAAHFRAAFDELGGIRHGLDVTALSIDYAMRVTGSAVGLPSAERGRVALWSGAQSGLLGRTMRGRELADAVGALGQLFTVSGRVVRAGTGGFAARLRAAGIPRRVATAALANSLAAGVHTVSGSIQQGVQRLLSDPDRQWWKLLGDQHTAGQVAAKVLQLDPGLVAWKRLVTEPITLADGTELTPGPVLVMFAAANRDPAAFPECLNLRGPGKRPLTFGFGRHICPGRQLATLAVEVFLRELYELAPHARPDRRHNPTRPADLLFSGADVLLSA
ncbi:cytochrome P450 [Nocardia cyriacigeorgica]|uniref:cytochrome P450 n=1 Tax=Nocardia cyriacigeorgica TaxID=135487 RepID=UPI0018940ACB|nr:cytochrome P450 [Nocardia cyriacigeorgica]MBF6101371.1 cytochrome P450 [Nocardia cyriacigeorgica]MBF6162271.1 cytochrome P450 [Nocardia cyriacigeorgica]MBF6201230.1 cytochrome P450 [Nocardia cyriacigeorgica]MBF6516609.1 cytochrome P450 [Nocardia cyriacigeorgica]